MRQRSRPRNSTYNGIPKRKQVVLKLVHVGDLVLVYGCRLFGTSHGLACLYSCPKKWHKCSKIYKIHVMTHRSVLAHLANRSAAVTSTLVFFVTPKCTVVFVYYFVSCSTSAKKKIHCTTLMTALVLWFLAMYLHICCHPAKNNKCAEKTNIAKLLHGKPDAHNFLKPKWLHG